MPLSEQFLGAAFARDGRKAVLAPAIIPEFERRRVRSRAGCWGKLEREAAGDPAPLWHRSTVCDSIQEIPWRTTTN